MPVNELSEITQNSEVCMLSGQVHIYLKEVLDFQEINLNLAKGFIL